MAQDKRNNPVHFTQQQYEYLDKHFPEQINQHATHEELRFYMGQRNLVMFIKEKVQK